MFAAFLPSSGISSLGPSLSDNSVPDTRIEDGKLLYERRWYEKFYSVVKSCVAHNII